jgi:hypothetical protein
MAKKERLEMVQVEPEVIVKHLRNRINSLDKIHKFMREITKNKDPIYLGSWNGEVRMVIGRKLVYSRCRKGDAFSLSFGVTMCVRKILEKNGEWIYRFPSGAQIDFTPNKAQKDFVCSESPAKDKIHLIPNPRSSSSWLHEKYLDGSTYSVAKNMIEKISVAEMISSPCEETETNINFRDIAVSNYKFRNMKFIPYGSQYVADGKLVYLDFKIRVYNDISRREADMLR